MVPDGLLPLVRRLLKFPENLSFRALGVACLRSDPVLNPAGAKMSDPRMLEQE